MPCQLFFSAISSTLTCYLDSFFMTIKWGSTHKTLVNYNLTTVRAHNTPNTKC